MTVADQVLHALRSSLAGMSDAKLAGLLGKRHQHVNQTCRALSDQGLIVRNSSLGSTTNQIAKDLPQPTSALPTVPSPAGSVDDDWTWEGNVQRGVATQLATTGWRIVTGADAAYRRQGTDIIAQRDGTRLLVEVKGWPNSTFAPCDHVGKPKSTRPTLLATHWSVASLTTLIRRVADLSARLTLPDLPRYRILLAEAGWAILQVEIIVYLVKPDGAAHKWEPEN